MLVVTNTYSKEKMIMMMIMIMMTILILITLVIIKNRLIENYGNIVVISIRLALKGMCEHVKGKKTEEEHVTKH